MRKMILILLVLAAGTSAFALYGRTTTDPVYYWNQYTGSTARPVVTVVALSDAEAQAWGCAGSGYKCLVRLDDQLQETDLVYERSAE